VQKLEQMLKAHREAVKEGAVKGQFNDTTIVFSYLDNKIIEAYACNLTHFTKEELGGVMEEQQFMHLMRHQLRELNFLLRMPFVQFWFELVKDSKLVEFFDALLLNFRKFRDTYKLQLIAEISQASKLEVARTDMQTLINEVLSVVLKVFYRVSLVKESDEDQFDPDYYRKLVHDNWLVDVAKLFDIAAIFGRSNPEVVQSLINHVFENDKRFVSEYKESIDSIISICKKAFSSSAKIGDMVRGEMIIERMRSEQD
jgi:hypothetical protein